VDWANKPEETEFLARELENMVLSKIDYDHKSTQNLEKLGVSSEFHDFTPGAIYNKDYNYSWKHRGLEIWYKVL